MCVRVSADLVAMLLPNFCSPLDGSANIEVVHVQVAVELEVGLGKLKTQLEILLVTLKNANERRQDSVKPITLVAYSS